MKPYFYLLSCMLLSLSSLAQKITLDPNQLYYEEPANSFSLKPLADEQSSITGTLTDNSRSPRPTSYYFPSSAPNPQVVVPLGGVYTLSQVALFDAKNQANLTVKYHNGTAWVELFKWDMSYHDRWRVVNVQPVTTNKLLFAWDNVNFYVGELSVFGSLSAGDIQPPSAPANLTASGITKSSVNLAWEASTDDVGVTGYDIYGNGALLATVSGTTLSTPVSGLTTETSYSFKVKAKDAANNQSDFSNEVNIFTCDPQKLVLTTGMVVNEVGGGDAGKLVDEQSDAGDPANGTGIVDPLDSYWVPGSFPASAYIDLGSTTFVSSVYLRDIEDGGSLMVEAGTPGNWKLLFTDNLTGTHSWNAHQVNVNTRYLRFTLGTSPSKVAEVVVYGCTGTLDTTPPAAVTTLKAGTVVSNAVQLSWTATGDDDGTGTASSYDVRYSTTAIASDADFANALQASGEPQPMAAGSLQHFYVTGLSANTQYYFAMKVQDEAANVSALSNTASGVTMPIITVDQMIGTNAFVDDPVEKMSAVGFIREYHNWNWDEGDIWSGGGDTSYPGYPKNEIKWQPSEAGPSDDKWKFDDFYARVKNAGLGISPCIQGSVAWLHGGTDFPSSNKPIDEPGDSSTDPHSYEKKSHHMFQFAARYGASLVADDKLTLDATQPRHTGLKLTKYVEDWNEQDRDWEGADAYFSPQEYAAMASADYDGHANTMKERTGAPGVMGTFGVKNADPNIKLVMGGIYKLNLDYIKQMKTWFETNRPDKKFAVDVINVHHYAFNSNGRGPALSPEENDYKGKMKTFVDYRNQNLPGVEVWISEFGWDTHSRSVLRPYVASGFDIQEVQGQWIVRTYLALAAAGVDRAQQYMLRDVDPNSSGQFASSGLVGPKGDWKPKKSWWYVYTLKNTLKNMVYIGEQPSGDAKVLIYKFKEVGSNRGVYAVWAKTKENYVVNGYKLALTNNSTSATRIEMAVGDTDGVSTALTIVSGAVSINVSERPVFVEVNNIE